MTCIAVFEDPENSMLAARFLKIYGPENKRRTIIAHVALHVRCWGVVTKLVHSSMSCTNSVGRAPELPRRCNKSNNISAFVGHFWDA